MLQYDVKVKYPLIAIKFTRAVARVCIRSLNQWNRSISVRLLFRFSLRDSISRLYEKCSNVTIFNIIFSLVFLSSSFRCISKATITRGTGRIFDWLKIRAFINRCSFTRNHLTGTDLGGGYRGYSPPSRDELQLSNSTGILQDMAPDMHDLYSQQFTLCYCLVKSLRLRIRF